MYCAGVVLLVWLFSPTVVYGDDSTSVGNAQPGSGGNTKAQKKGADLHSEMTLSFMEAIQGCVKTISYTVNDACEPCGSTGKVLGGKKKHCAHCHGQGYTTTALAHGMKVKVECEVCQGEGRLHPLCGECKGSGVTKAQRQVEVKIPAGVNEATAVRLLHMGDAGKRGG